MIVNAKRYFPYQIEIFNLLQYLKFLDLKFLDLKLLDLKLLDLKLLDLKFTDLENNRT